jgi:hypothetical protein
MSNLFTVLDDTPLVKSGTRARHKKTYSANQFRASDIVSGKVLPPADQPGPH